MIKKGNEKNLKKMTKVEIGFLEPIVEKKSANNFFAPRLLIS